MGDRAGMSAKEEVVRAFYDARARHDHEALRPLVTDDVVFHEPGDESYSGDYVGADALIEHLDRLLAQTEGTFTLEPTATIETEDYAAARISWFAERGDVRSEGLELAVFRFRDGKIAEVAFFQDDYDLVKLREVFG
jgi:ketosteroid isomerase-like protein